jgi:hypothetical protein
MATKVIRNRDQTLKRIDIECDACGRVETDDTIMAGGGLLKMGWLRRFNAERHEYEHFCPEHHPKEEPGGN